jgi:hypothetical protein
MARAARLARLAGWAGLLAACTTAVACSSNNNPPPDAFISADVGGATPDCNIEAVPNWLPIGTPTADKPTTVSDQGSTGSGTASVTCTVHPQGSGFDIELSVASTGMPGGNISITSPSGQGVVTTSGGSGISASFYSNNRGPYSSSNCTITYTYNGQPVPVSPPIAAGRIWGHISCPQATDSSQTTTGPDGGPATVSCPANADFLFEQCNQ